MNTLDDWKHLHEFGYVPGDYIMFCRDCNTQQFNCGKRSLRCRSCAENLYKKHVEDLTSSSTSFSYNPVNPIQKFRWFNNTDVFETWQKENSVNILSVTDASVQHNAKVLVVYTEN